MFYQGMVEGGIFPRYFRRSSGKINLVCGDLPCFNGIRIDGQDFGLSAPFKGTNGDISCLSVDKRTESGLIARNGPFSGKGKLGG